MAFSIKTYLLVFIICSFIGFVYESYVGKFQINNQNNNQKLEDPIMCLQHGVDKIKTIDQIAGIKLPQKIEIYGGTTLTHDRTIYKIFGIKLPFLIIYGFSAIVLLFIFDKTENNNIAVRILLASLVINFLECFSGLVSYHIHRCKTWNYPDVTIPLCKGYISVFTFIWWTILIGIIYGILNMFVKK